MLAAIPFVLILIVYVVGSAERRATDPEDKLLPTITEMARAVEPARSRAGSAVRANMAVDDTAASLQRLGAGARHIDADRALASGSRSDCCRWWARRSEAHRRDLDDSADGGLADIVHRVRARPIVQGHADRHRRRPVSGPRHVAGGTGPAARADDQGADPGCLDMAGRDPGGAAAECCHG